MSQGALALPCRNHFRGLSFSVPCWCALRKGARKLYDKLGAFAFFRFYTDTTSMRLQDLVHDRQTEARAACETGLKWFEDSRQFAGVQSDAGVAYRDAHPCFISIEFHGEKATIRHRAQSVVTEVPKDLF